MALQSKCEHYRKRSQIVYTMRHPPLMNSSFAIGHAKHAGGVMGFTRTKPYFYFALW